MSTSANRKATYRAQRTIVPPILWSASVHLLRGPVSPAQAGHRGAIAP